EAALLVEGKGLQRSYALTVAGFDALHAWMRKPEVEQVPACLEATGGGKRRVWSGVGTPSVGGGAGGQYRHPGAHCRLSQEAVGADEDGRRRTKTDEDGRRRTKTDEDGRRRTRPMPR